jgi:hypothetical protein
MPNSITIEQPDSLIDPYESVICQHANNMIIRVYQSPHVNRILRRETGSLL